MSVVLLSALPALATITKIQSNATWNTNVGSCSVTLTNTVSQHLLVVWATWSPSSLTATVNDLPNTNSFPGAVGPTVQSVSNTAAQIFYAKSIAPASSDSIQVNFSGGTATTASCVAVEYSGADTMYPLDSVSAGYSTSGNATSLLDSGTVAPANSNLLVFGGGISDAGTATPGTNFTSIQSNGSAITEQNTNPITGNNTLWRGGWPPHSNCTSKSHIG